jgi:hypothetical protein
MAVYSISKSGIALVATADQTLIMVKAVTDTLRVLGWGVSFDGVQSADVPVLVEYAKASTDGTATDVTADIVAHLSTDTPSAEAYDAFTVEPTVGDPFEQHLVTPNGGLLVMQYATAESVQALDTERVIIRATAPTSDVNASVWITFEENF